MARRHEEGEPPGLGAHLVAVGFGIALTTGLLVWLGLRLAAAALGLVP